MSFLSYPPPRYGGTKGLINASFRPADAEPDLVSGDVDGGVTGTSARQQTRYLATGASTGGEFGLYRVDMPPRGTGPSTHFHRTISESFFVLSGSVRLFDGQNWIDATPGDFLYVPVGGCTRSTTPRTPLRQCCCCSRPVRHAKPTSKDWPRSRT